MVPPETERCGNAGQHRHRKQSAQSSKKASLANAGRQFCHEVGDGGHSGSNSTHATTEPADRPRQCHLRPANHIGDSFHAAARLLHHGNASLDRVEQARQPNSKKIWQQAECPMPLWAVPPGNAKARRCLTRITAVPGK